MSYRTDIAIWLQTDTEITIRAIISLKFELAEKLINQNLRYFIYFCIYVKWNFHTNGKRLFSLLMVAKNWYALYIILQISLIN